jgi:hypothetical protein
VRNLVRAFAEDGSHHTVTSLGDYRVCRTSHASLYQRVEGDHDERQSSAIGRRPSTITSIILDHSTPITIEEHSETGPAALWDRVSSELPEWVGARR